MRLFWVRSKTWGLGGWQAQVGPLKLSIEPGFGWVRLFGVGVIWKDYSRHKMLFSEREGDSRRLRVGSWGLGWLS